MSSNEYNLKEFKKTFNSLNQHQKNSTIHTILNNHLFENYDFIKPTIHFLSDSNNSFNQKEIYVALNYQLNLIKSHTINQENTENIEKTIQFLLFDFNPNFGESFDNHLMKTDLKGSEFLTKIYLLSNETFEKIIKLLPSSSFYHELSIAKNIAFNNDYSKLPILFDSIQENPIAIITAFKYSTVLFFKDYFKSYEKNEENQNNLNNPTSIAPFQKNIPAPDYEAFKTFSQNKFIEIFQKRQYLLDHFNKDYDNLIKNSFINYSNRKPTQQPGFLFQLFLEEVTTNIKKTILLNSIEQKLQLKEKNHFIKKI